MACFFERISNSRISDRGADYYIRLDDFTFGLHVGQGTCSIHEHSWTGLGVVHGTRTCDWRCVHRE